MAQNLNGKVGMLNKNYPGLFYLFTTFLLCGCSSPGTKLFGKKTPHEQYEKKIIDAGLEETALGDAWLKAAAVTLSNPLDIYLPYSETGYFANDEATAIGLRFSAKRGQKLKLRVVKKPETGFNMYVDLWHPHPAGGNTQPKFLVATDTADLALEYLVNEDSVFIVRIQPELLKEGQYTLVITAGPSLAFPVPPEINSNIGSFFGAGRDKGERKHEGIDIFAPIHSPVVAAADGIVTAVNENSLGGKVIFMRPDNSPYTLYYAHLDSQIAVEGQQVKTGDILGLTGNTGNARFTSSHLHFGVYANYGAVDPLYFVKALDKDPAVVTVPLVNLNTWMRSKKNARLYLFPSSSTNKFIAAGENTLLKPQAASGNLYRVILPDGSKGFIPGTSLTSALKTLKKLVIKKAQPMYSSPDSLGLHKLSVLQGDKINVLADFKDFYYVSDKNNIKGWILKKQ